MSEEQNDNQQAPEETTPEASPQANESNEVELSGYFVSKQGMSSVFSEEGKMIPVTVLKYEPWFVSQVKTKEKDGYEAVQIASGPKKAKNSNKAEVGHLKNAGFENGARHIREIRQNLPGSVKVGQRVALNSLAKGDRVRISGFSKGRGFSGAVKRWGFGGGPKTHGSHFHRAPGAIGNCTFPGRVMPGRKMPGQYGVEKVTVPRAEVVDVIPEENVVLVKGAVPGARNSVVQLTKV